MIDRKNSGAVRQDPGEREDSRQGVSPGARGAPAAAALVLRGARVHGLEAHPPLLAGGLQEGGGGPPGQGDGVRAGGPVQLDEQRAERHRGGESRTRERARKAWEERV